MGFVSKEWVGTQFGNFASRISTVLAKKTEIPTKVSDLTNDSGYVSDADVETENIDFSGYFETASAPTE